MPKQICAIDGAPLQTYQTHTTSVRLRDHTGHETATDQDFLAANITGYELILGMPWLRTQNPDIDWSAAT